MRGSFVSILTFALISHGILFAAESTGKIRGSVSVQGRPAHPTVVYIEKAKAESGPNRPKAQLAQKNEAFEPETLVVVQGDTVDFPNYDKFFHNVFSLSPGNEFDLGLYRAGASKSLQMREPGEVEVYCNIHPGMAAKILVLQNSFYAMVRNEGTYTLSHVPAGTYELVAWSPEHRPEKSKVVVEQGKTETVNFSLKLREEPKMHLNKDGEQYGRYK